MIIKSAEATEFLGQSRQGQRLPMILRCVTETEEHVCLVKILSGRTALTVREMCLEILGTLLAQMLDLEVAAPILVRLTNRVKDRLENQYSLEITSDWAFGASFVYGLTPFIPKLRRDRALHADIGVTFALDMLLANSDRTTLNPNLAWKSGRLFVYDFEQCLNLPSLPLAARFDAHCALAANLSESHVLFPLDENSKLEASKCFQEFPNRLAGSSFLRTMEDFLPSEWLEDWRQLVTYIEYVGANASTLQRSSEL